MKKIFLFFFFFLAVFMTYAQELSKISALSLVKQHRISAGLSDNDLDNVRVTNSYIDQNAGGVTMVYLQQVYKGIPVHNQIQVLAFKNNVLMSNTGGRLPMDKFAKDKSSTASISPESAIYAALSSKKLTATKPAGVVSTKENGRIIEFSDLGISTSNITAELLWFPLKNNVNLAWQVQFTPVNTSDAWQITVDARDGAILDIYNRVITCNWGGDNIQNAAHDHSVHLQLGFLDQLPQKPAAATGSFNIVNGASYLVIPFPAENRLVAGGTPAIVTDPWTMAPGNATTLKWHSDGTTDYNTTRGNNVRAYEDRNNSGNGGGNGVPGNGNPATSTTADPLTFQFTPDFTVTPVQTTPVQNQQFNTTNLFYWANIIHDLTYLYGLDEVSGNYQVNNLGRGGAGNDPVLAEAQDASGTNNANFYPTPDGVSGRMQMYLWTQNGSNPIRDGDADNGVMVHEYGHGISNRLTGGPATASCLQNAEQMGEGWSDYYGLMYTQNWATTGLNGGTIARGFGLYALNGGNLFAGSAPGTGIRHYKYSTDMSVNPLVYTTTLPSSPHDRGEIWAATLWDMTWNIINQVGTINPNLFNPAGGGGNVIALKLVTEGMKLQPCSPGFISGRDAILAADQLLYGGAYACAIKEAFRRRGMGDGASQGSSSSITDQVPSFAGGVTLKLTESIINVPEGQNITYTNAVSTCSPVSNYLLTDTLPSNVTYVSGGTYNAATRVVSFPVNLGQGASQNYVFTVSVNPGSYFPPVNLLDEQVTATTIPATWTASVAQGPSNWVVSTAQSHTAPNSFFAVDNSTAVTDFRLATTNNIAIDATAPSFSFWHYYNTEATWDGGVVEISTDGGTVWTDLGPNMIQNGYNNIFGTGTILAGKSGFSGNSGSFIKTEVNLANYVNSNIKLRFRAVSDNNTAAVGWYVDDILLTKKATVSMRSSLFNSGGARINVSDTIANIIQSATCINVAITAQPVNTSACSGSDATITVTATGQTPAYQWQVSTDGGTNWNPVAGATAASLTLTSVTAGMSGNRYRVIVSNTCPSTITSSVVTLTVSSAANINTQPQNTAVCAGSTASFSVGATGSTLSYQWQVSTNSGGSWADIAGETNATLNVAGITASQNNNQYRVVVFSCSPTGINSSAATLTVNAGINVTTHPANAVVCENTNATFTVAATGTGATYQWQVSTNSGTTWTAIPGATSATLTVPGVTFAQNNNQYRAVVSGTCTPGGVNSNAATLTVNTLVAISAQPVGSTLCAGLNTSFSVTATGTGLTYQWQVSTDGGATWNNVTGATAATLTLTAVAATMNNNQYRVVLNGTCTTNLNSTAVTLVVNTPVILTSQPVNVSACAGTTATFGVTATGTTITYQWQVSVNNGPFVDIANGGTYSGVNTATLTLSNISTSLNGYRYRVVANGVPCGGVTSNAATLTANPTPTVVLTAASYANYDPSISTGLFATTSPAGLYTYQWFKNNAAISVTTASFPLSGDDFGEYYVIATNTNGCSHTSNKVTVADSASNLLFIYPNPNSGKFQVRYYNKGGSTVERKMVIYDSKGAQVFMKEYTVSGPYGRMDVDLKKASAGIYVVELLDKSNNRLSSGKVNIIKH